jgi:hypothetical protein
LDGGGSPRQSSLRCGEEAWTPETRVYAQGPAYPGASHPKPDENDKMHKGPRPSVPTVGAQNHRLVNFYYCMFRIRWCAKRTQNVYWFELNVPTSSGELPMLLALWSVVRVTNGRETDELLGLW